MCPSIEELVVSRLHPIALLKENAEMAVSKHNLVERMLRPSPYMPSVALEAEFVIDRYRSGQFPINAFNKVLSTGIKQGKDGLLTEGYKIELDLPSVSGTHLVHANEIAMLKQLGIFDLKDRRRNYLTEFYPIHVNLEVPADIPYWDEGRNKPNKYFDRSEWIKLRYQGNEKIRQNVIGLSDVFLLARIFDATGWATSADRILMPFSVYKEKGILSGFMAKGNSGVTRRGFFSTDSGESVTEIRTCEIWGERSLPGFQKYLRTIQYIGSMYKSYSIMPLEVRDNILSSELRGNFDRGLELIMGYSDFDLPEDANLAYLWCEMRRKAIRIFTSHGLKNPMREYNRKEFVPFAKNLPTIGSRKPRMGMMNEARSLLTNYRGKVASIIENT